MPRWTISREGSSEPRKSQEPTRAWSIRTFMRISAAARIKCHREIFHLSMQLRAPSWSTSNNRGAITSFSSIQWRLQPHLRVPMAVTTLLLVVPMEQQWTTAASQLWDSSSTPTPPRRRRKVSCPWWTQASRTRSPHTTICASISAKLKASWATLTSSIRPCTPITTCSLSTWPIVP